MTWGKKRKYGNCKVQGEAGHWFDSQLEKALYADLVLRERAGAISELKHHPGTVFLSDARIQYRPDFCFIEGTSGSLEYAEAKGFETDAWRIKRKLWISYGPSKLWIYKGSAARLTLAEVIGPGRAA